jgi:AraC-like DNA-binding protein
MISKKTEKNVGKNNNFGVTYNYVCRNLAEMPRHRHKEFELIHIISTSMRLFIYIDGKRYTVSDGDIILIKNNLAHFGNINNAVYESISFDIDSLRPFTSSSVSDLISPIKSENFTISPLLSKGSSKIYPVALEIFTIAAKKSKYYELSLTAHLYSMFYYLYKDGFVKPVENPLSYKNQTNAVDSAIDYISEHIAEQITLYDLSNISQMNEKYFCKLFKEKTGYTPIDYINRTKIEIACNILTSENAPVTDVAMKTGFDDISYFIRLFKRYTGVTPTQYKKQKIAEHIERL